MKEKHAPKDLDELMELLANMDLFLLLPDPTLGSKLIVRREYSEGQEMTIKSGDKITITYNLMFA